MIVIVFALGRPGSGKSTAAHHLSEVAWREGLSTIRLGDYDILYHMSKEDRDGRFEPTCYDGFNVLDFTVLDEALENLKRRVEERVQRVSPHDDQLIVIEFARNNYLAALQHFGPDLLKKAYFVYVDADLERCKKRIQMRAKHPRSPDDHFVSTKILDSYYATDDGVEVMDHLRNRCGISPDQLFFIKNRGLPQQFAGQMKRTIHAILQHFPQLAGNAGEDTKRIAALTY